MKCKEMKEALDALGTPPCEKCLWRRKCGAERLACWDFTAWIATGRTQRKGKDGRVLPPSRQPKRFLYERLFKDE